jgi:hypothetical protein
VIQIHSELITQVGEQENIVGENYFLNQSAKEAYRSYILAYNSHAMKDIFNVHDLDMKVLFIKFFLNAKAQYFVPVHYHYPLHTMFLFGITIHCKC